uniref:Protein amnionless n=1 Tax=Anolis carolinensis TaxID=28377 RepID=A0A803TZ08_ANOCA
WIPNTNFEHISNWDQDRVPCARDVILFDSNEYMPLNGEFIMAPGAGFAAFDGSSNPGCETATFSTAQNYQWYDPTLWHGATSLENLDQEKYIFSVDEERVPCQYDDVIFPPETSFRVNIASSEQMIQLRSISIMGQKFTSDNRLEEYMQSPSAQLQFHGQGTFRLSNVRCPDKSGCECGNTADHDRICAALLQNSGNQCPVATCKDPLKPVGHCCEICGECLRTMLALWLRNGGEHQPPESNLTRFDVGGNLYQKKEDCQAPRELPIGRVYPSCKFWTSGSGSLDK